MIKVLKYLISITLLSLTVAIITLSTIGIETNKFNQLISEKVSNKKNINIKLKTIKFKIDPKKLSLFLDTQNPIINYRNIYIPAKNVKVYIDFWSLLKSEPKIKKSNLLLEELDIVELNKISKILKPSNFKSLLNNKVKKGKLISEIEIYLNDDGSLNNFIAKGEVKKLEANLIENLNLTNANFSFFADRSDVLIKNIFGTIKNINFSEGDIKLNLENGIKVNSNFNSDINLDEKFLNENIKFFRKPDFLNNIKNLKANFNNSFFIDFDDTFKVNNYNYKFSGQINKSKIELSKPFKNSFVFDEIKEIYLSDINIQSIFSPKNIEISGDGSYSFNNLNFLKIDFVNKIKEDLYNLQLNFDFKENFKIDLINYKKSNNSLSKLNIDLQKKNENIELKSFKLSDGKDSIQINNLKLKSNEFSTFKKIIVKTKNNDFFIENDKKILIKGNRFDAINIFKFFNTENEVSLIKKFNSKIEIDFKNINFPMSERLKNFRLIGEIKLGKFTKISAKGDYGGNNFLDISMKKEKIGNKKYLEIYSDLTRPLLTEYNFFNGLSGGKLFYTSIIDGSKYDSKLKIENFKVINAPGLIKLLSLADLGGLADLAEGDGLSFDILEIKMQKDKNILKLSEILALGPSISVLMEGYQDKSGLTSLRGTLIPAKTLNKLISKIPLLGDIIIPKEVGEGLFGVSFKMKGQKGKIKTTINPIRTLTPRFIQKIIDKNKAIN